jgi:4-hydroxy-4-methyl-2-oxoglutarate aldolase
MTVTRYKADFRRLNAKELAVWREFGTAEISDCLGRSMGMHAAIKPLDIGFRLVGQARTIRCMAGDNSALHAALNIAEKGDLLVVDGHSFENVAIWGGLMAYAAIRKGIAGLVVDGAVRDSEEIRSLGFVTFARAIVPSGPHKGFGGEIDCAISCGGTPVMPGDLIIGDADGVSVVPVGQIADTLKKATELKNREKVTLEKLNQGGSLSDIYGVPDVVEAPRSGN